MDFGPTLRKARKAAENPRPLTEQERIQRRGREMHLRTFHYPAVPTNDTLRGGDSRLRWNDPDNPKE